MDFEKKYKEAVAELSRIANDPNGEGVTLEKLECIFPELAESEEERIRKAIKYGLDHVFTNNTTIYEVRKEQCLAWIKKQGEQKPVEEKVWSIYNAKNGDVLNSERVQATIIFKGFADDGKHILAYCSLQKGIFISQELPWDRDFEPASEFWKNALYDAMTEKGYEWDAENIELKKIEQKPAWSEEDETITNHLIALLQNSTTHNAALRTVNEEIENWLKSLKERVQPQPKQEWSEEDEENLYHINALIKDSSLEVYRQEHLSSWLASFKQKKHWKPSDEQMSAIQESIGIVGELTPRGELLKELLEQLKKLREG